MGGATLARHQLAVALAMGCERVICIARGVTGDVLALQHAAESAGVRFHVVPGPRGLMGLVAATDEILALSEGLLASPDDLGAALGSGAGVVVQPVETGLASGFERIDINHAAGGAMRVPGRLIERLADLPPDCDAISALQRIALQAGVPQRLLSTEPRETGRWMLVRDEIEAHAAERVWIRQHTSLAGAATPSEFVARQAIRSFGPALLHANSGGSALVIGAIFLALLALGAGWFGYPVIAFLFCALAWLVRKAGALLARIEADSMHRPRSRLASKVLYEAVVDGIVVVVVCWTLPVVLVPGAFYRAFAPIMLVALVRLAPRVVERRWSGWLGDRALLALVLAGAASAGVLSEAVQVLAVLLALLATLLPAAPERITAV
ncbi:MAG: hypothetical protein KGL44_00350 [Sphingomonadales bacterium]|nr:hypothetical protein [Sphingomonadales bacterium]